LKLTKLANVKLCKSIHHLINFFDKYVVDEY